MKSITFRLSTPAIGLLLIPALFLHAGDFPEPYDSEKDKNAKPMPAAEAARGMRLPEGFRATVFASEPDVRNPIAMTWDTRGRMWVAENFTYAERPIKFDLNLRDRVLIFSDPEGTGKPGKPKVFIDTVQRLTSVEVGLGGVWLMCPPQLLFVSSKDMEKPDGPPQVVLEGFNVPSENYHNLANGLKWGPDGWLYGRCGASAPGMVQRPDQDPKEAIPLAGGIWRYHPKTKVFEALCSGTTNPWGHDWNSVGDCFFVNTVNGHLWQMIPGAHYRRPHTIDPNPLVYEPMEMIADHWHFDTGKGWVDSRKVSPEVDRLGGGHAHSGCMIYNGDQWPKEYRDKLFTLNFHGRRMNVERLERSGSGYVGKHDPDTMFVPDPFFRGIEVSQGPDGSAYVLDWSDTGECHEQSGVHRNSGRIYKITYGNPKPVPAPDLTKMDVPEIFRLSLSNDAWLSRMATRQLLDLIAGKQMPFYAAQLDSNLRKLNLSRLIHDLHPLEMTRFADMGEENTACWMIRILLDNQILDTVTGRVRATPIAREEFRYLSDLAIHEVRPKVQLELASALQRLPVADRLSIAGDLLRNIKDINDPNLPFMIWYGLIPVANATPKELIPLAAEGKLPQVRLWTARCFGERIAKSPELVEGLLAATKAKDASVRADVIKGLNQGMAGLRQAKMPASWKDYAKGVAEPALAQRLDVIFGDGVALDEVRKLALSGTAELGQRKAALETLIASNPPDLRDICEKTLKVKFLNPVAARGLGRFDDPAIGKLLVKEYNSFHLSERPAVVEVLTARPSFAAALLDAILAKQIPRTDLSAAQARAIRNFDNPELTKKLATAWGEFRDTPKDKADLIAKLKADLTPEHLKSADRSAGRQIFAKTCAACHTMFGAGGAIGPNLTGADRRNLDYLLGKVVDPSAVVTRDFQVTKFLLADGRTVAGVVLGENAQSVTVQTATEKLSLAKSEIEDRKPSTQSLMPEGQLLPMQPQEIRNLIAYLMGDGQVELPAGR